MKIVKKVSLLFIMFFTTSVINAQPPSGDNDGEDPDAAIPIDGGVSVLLAAGAAFGAKKMIDKRKESKKTIN